MTIDPRTLDLIRRLTEMRVDRGCTPAEAAAAAAHLARVLEKHQLSLFDVQKLTFAEDVVEEVRPVGGKVVPRWAHELAQAVSRPHDCEYFIRTAYDPQAGRRRSEAYFIGHRSDAAVAAYLYEVLSRTLLAMADREGRAQGRRHAGLIRFRSHYIIAAAWEVRQRIEAERRQARGEAALASRALVVVKEKAVEEYVRACHPKLKVIDHAPVDYDTGAIVAGGRAGREVELKKGIEQAEAARALPAPGA